MNGGERVKKLKFSSIKKTISSKSHYGKTRQLNKYEIESNETQENIKEFGLQIELPHPSLAEVLREHNVTIIKCGAAPVVSSYSSDIFESGGSHTYIDCEGNGLLLIRKHDGKIIEIGCGEVHLVEAKLLAHKGSFWGKLYAWMKTEYMILYDITKDDLPCSIMHTLKEVKE